MILYMLYFTNFGDLCDSGSFYLYGFPGSTTHLIRNLYFFLLKSFISEIKLFLFYSYSYLIAFSNTAHSCISNSSICNLCSADVQLQSSYVMAGNNLISFKSSNVKVMYCSISKVVALAQLYVTLACFSTTWVVTLIGSQLKSNKTHMGR